MYILIKLLFETDIFKKRSPIISNASNGNKPKSPLTYNIKVKGFEIKNREDNSFAKRDFTKVETMRLNAKAKSNIVTITKNFAPKLIPNNTEGIAMNRYVDTKVSKFVKGLRLGIPLY